MSEPLGECYDGPFLLPAYERRVKYRRKSDGTSGDGTVTCHWMALDAVAVQIAHDDGTHFNIIPEFGDTWEYT